MGGIFFGLNVAVSGLFTSQKNLDVVNQNISNANTPGYSRQVTIQDSLDPVPTSNKSGMIGSGSEVIAITRVRDEYLDQKFWRENIIAGEAEVKFKILSDIQGMISEPLDSGFTYISNEFVNSMNDLKKDPGSPAARSVVTQKAEALTKYFNSLSERYNQMQSNVNQNINSITNEVNSIGYQVSCLNKQIFAVEINGSAANELRDKRTVLLDKLSKLVDIDVYEVTKGKFQSGLDDKRTIVKIGGKAFVDDEKYSRFTIVERATQLNDEDIPGLYDLKWDDGNTLKVSGGALRGYLDMRDGNSGLGESPDFKGIPYNVRRLNNFVRVYARAFNEGYIDTNGDEIITQSEDGIGHADGFGVDPDGATGSMNSPVGIRFFTRTGDNNRSIDSKTFVGDAKTQTEIDDRYDSITASNFSVCSDIQNNYNNIATSDKPNEIGNISILENIINMRNQKNMFSEGAPEDYMKATIISMAIDMQQSERINQIQNIMLRQAENRRMSESGVSLDEEMSMMIKHQQAYSASAKMISTWAEIFEILINKTGV